MTPRGGPGSRYTAGRPAADPLPAGGYFRHRDAGEGEERGVAGWGYPCRTDAHAPALSSAGVEPPAVSSANDRIIAHDNGEADTRSAHPGRIAMLWLGWRFTSSGRHGEQDTRNNQRRGGRLTTHPLRTPAAGETEGSTSSGVPMKLKPAG